MITFVSMIEDVLQNGACIILYCPAGDCKAMCTGVASSLPSATESMKDAQRDELFNY